MSDKTRIVDVTGQVGGPSPEEQARVDAEQAVLIKRIKAERGDADVVRQQERDRRQEAAEQRAAEWRALLARIDGLEARVHVLEGRT